MEGLIDRSVDVVVGLLAAIVALLLWWRRRRRPPEPSETEVFPTAIPQLDWLSTRQQERWHLQTARFLREKRFLGCAGFVIEAEHRRCIASMASLLRLQAGAESEPLFPTVHEVLVYPDTFLVPPPRQTFADDGLELVDDAPQERIGEHGPGQVVLSWADVEAALAGDPVNVVVHEFAHALDSENPYTEGAPPMADYTHWSTVMAAEFARLARHRRPPVLDPYGAESPAEFWCVVAEAFFQQPAALAAHHPTLFALLVQYFEISPPLPSGGQPIAPAQVAA